ncbi:response regulator [Comamonas aquatica]|uniref:response regulator n=1 Tax=Comamonas aquatica TaxID=225991 RepID=UPI003CFFFEC0
MKLSFSSLTAKIVALVACLGAVSGIITLYATWHMQRIEGQYHALLDQQVLVADKVSQVRQHLTDASSLVHASLRAPGTGQAQASAEQLDQTQQSFERTLHSLYPALPGYELRLDTVLMQARHSFAIARRIIEQTLHWHSDQALQSLTLSLNPAVALLHTEVEALRVDAQHVLAQSTQQMAMDTTQTIRQATWAGWLSLLLLCAGTAWIAWLHVSRPIGRLTRSMQRMSRQQYDTPIADQHRQDEIGSMARALQSFGQSLQEAEQLEQALVQHQNNQLLTDQLLQLTSALPGAVFQMRMTPDGAWRLTFVSPQWAQLMGMGASEDKDTQTGTVAQIIKHYDVHATATARQHFQDSAQTLTPVDFDVSMRMADGVTRWIKTRANPHMESDGCVVFNGVWLDVTKEVTQSLALEKAKRQAELVAQEKSNLQASISHEIRTPLNAILGLTQLLLKANLPETQHEQLQSVLRASQHLRGIVNEVLDFSKIDAGQLQLESTDFSLHDVVLDVLSMCREDASHKGLALDYHIAPQVPDSLRGDPHRIAQILLNYVNNAIKFTASGWIRIAIHLAPSSTLHRIILHASVQDTGPGIPADRMPLLFQAFQQADNSITRRFGGTGLGLTISRALAKLMGGETGVKSQLGQGSTFWFTALLEPARTPVQRTHAPTPTTWQGQRVLVVDDHPLNRAVVEGMLHAAGLQTEAAEDGVQALLRLQAVGPGHYHCILMDVQMPHMDGLSATKALRQMPGFESVPVIAMTAHTGVQDMERSKAAGMNAHLSKPLLESSLHAALQQWLAASSGAPTDRQDGSDAAPPSPPQPLVFDASAIDALAQLFNPGKLQQLVTQFANDSLQRARSLPALAAQHDWLTMRAEAHKLSGTAATFGLMRLGFLSSALSTALKAADAAQTTTLAQQIADCAEDGVAQLRAYCPACVSQA